MSETDRDFVSRMHDKHLRCEAMSFYDGNRVFALALSGAEAAALTARVKALEAALEEVSHFSNEAFTQKIVNDALTQPAKENTNE